MITRENYEEFFLSYVDDELPAETRVAVERFVAAYPELREELEVLLQCRMEPQADATVFPDKHSLLQYEESLLLYVDGELDDAGRKTVETLVRQEPRLETDLSRLQMTVSRPDPAIVFPDKESLYHPAKRRRVVMIPWLQAGVGMRPWLQAGVAVAVLAAVVFLVLPHGRKANPGVAAVKNNPAAVTPPATSPLYPVKKDEAMRTETTNVATTNSPGLMSSTNSTNPTSPTNPAKNRITIPAPPKTPTLPAPAVAETAPAVDTTSRLATLTVTSPANTTASTHSTAIASAVASTDPEKAAPPVTAVAAVYIPKEQSSFATQALLKEARDENNGEVADNMPPNTGKTKLRGLFRKVTRAFGKTAERDDDGQRQVSISVFQVALK